MKINGLFEIDNQLKAYQNALMSWAAGRYEAICLGIPVNELGVPTGTDQIRDFIFTTPKL